MKLKSFYLFLMAANTSSISKAGTVWECYQGEVPYEDKVIIDVSTDHMNVKRGRAVCDLFTTAPTSSNKNSDLLYRSIPRTCTEIFSSGYQGEVSWLESIHFPITRTGNTDTIKPVLFDIGMWDDLGASRPYTLQYKCNLEKKSKRSDTANLVSLFERSRYGECGVTSQGFQVCYNVTCQRTSCVEAIFLIKDGVEKSYPVVEPMHGDGQISRTLTLRNSAGTESRATIKYYYERGGYPGDGEYYPIHLSGTTPDGLNFDTDVKGQRF